MRFIKENVVRALSWRVLVQPGKRFIFLYHDISEQGEFAHSKLYSTTPSRFREHVEFLALHFDFVSIDELLSPDLVSKRKRLATLTFDDGFLSVKEVALPYLSAKGIPFAVFLSRLAMTENRLFNGSEDGKLERSTNQKVFLDENDARSLSLRGVTIGSHTSSHRRLAACDHKTLQHEIDENKTYLESVTGQTVRHLALPFGKHEHYDQHVLNHCRQAGHEFILSSIPTYFDETSSDFAQRLIPRLPVDSRTIGELTFMINRPLFRRDYLSAKDSLATPLPVVAT